MTANRELTPRDVLADLFGSDDFPAAVFDTVHAAEIAIQRLNDDGFRIVSATGTAEAALAEIRQLLAEGKFTGNYLIGMIEGIAKHGPTTREDRS